MLNEFRIPPAKGSAPDHAIIFLHGVGDSGSGGLLSIGEVWQEALPTCEFLCPDAPFAYDMAPADFGGRQWFSLASFAPEAILAGAEKAAPLLNEYIDHVLATRNLTPDKLALVGFSQGTIMALYVAPRRPARIAGILGYSGLLTGGEKLRADKKSSPPVHLIHGKMDDVIPWQATDMAEQLLKAAGISVTHTLCPMLGHGIDDLGLKDGLQFIQKILK